MAPVLDCKNEKGWIMETRLIYICTTCNFDVEGIVRLHVVEIAGLSGVGGASKQQALLFDGQGQWRSQTWAHPGLGPNVSVRKAVEHRTCVL